MSRYILSGILILLSLTSCLTIVQSFISPGNIFTDDRIEGQWVDSESKNIIVQKFMKSKFKNVFIDPEMKDWKYTREDSIFLTKEYVISLSEKSLDYTWLSGIVKIGDQYYLNLLPEECLNKKGEKEYDLGTETSSIAKLEWKNNNSLNLHFLDGDYIKKIILNGNARIKHENDPLFGTFVITASSDELVKFLEKYGNNENLFRGGNTIILKRKN